MHIRVTRARFDPGRADEVLRHVREQSVPAARKLPGFKSLQFGIDRQAGRFVAVTAFDEADQSQPLSAIRASLEAIGIQFESSEVCEVVIEG